MSTRTLFGSKSGSDGKIVFLGLPFSNGSEASNGCRQGPDCLRDISSSFNVLENHFFYDSDQTPFLYKDDICDLGNLEYRIQIGTERYLQDLSNITSALIEHQKKFVFCGGDHLATLGTIQGLSRKLKAFQIIHVDAHKDYRRFSEDELPTHANFMYSVEKMSEVEKVVQIGVRGFDAYPLNSKKVETISFNNNDDLASKITSTIDFQLPIFITIDVDAFDPLIIPAVNFPVPNGLNLEVVDVIFNTLKSQHAKILGCDWMEYNPELDTKNKIAGNQILYKIAKIIKLLSQMETL